MAFNIEGFKNAVSTGPVRTNLFVVSGTLPTVISNLVDPSIDVGFHLNFKVSAASIPPSNVTNIEVPFRGRKLKISGDREFEPWELSVLCDENMTLRTIFERWANAYNTQRTNIDETFDPVSANYMSYMDSEWKIDVLSRNGEVIPNAQYTLHYCWPTTVGSMELGFDNNNQITSFPVTMRYLYSTNATNTDQ